MASEVKDLAQETARATEDIGKQVERIQRNAGATSRMSEIVEQVNDYQTTIASAVEEQTATTAEMARNASSNTRQIADNLAGVATAASNTTAAIGDTQQSAMR